MGDATCRFCMHPLDGRSRKFCTTCLPRYSEWDDRRAYNRRYNLLNAAVGDHCSWPFPTCKWPRRRQGIVVRVCAYVECGQHYEGHSTSRYCSTECRDLAAYLRRTGIVKPTIPVRGSCAWCFDPCSVGDFCSPSCRSAMKQQLKTHRSPNSCPLPVCLDCRQVFGASPFGTGDWTDGNRCSLCLSSQSAAGRRRRHAKRHGDQVSIDKLIARDGHADCHLCDEPIDYDDRGGTWGPSVDHLHPLSEGGADVMDNAALAHKWCNSVRCTRTVAEARALLAG